MTVVQCGSLDLSLGYRLIVGEGGGGGGEGFSIDSAMQSLHAITTHTIVGHVESKDFITTTDTTQTVTIMHSD